MPIQIIPIRFIDQFGNPALPTDDVRAAIPVFDVALCAPGGVGSAAPKSGIGLVDTGADLNYATRAAIDRCALEANFETVTHSSHGSLDSTVFHGALYFHSTNLIINSDITADPIHNRPYELVVGRLTLKVGCLIMDYYNGVFEWRVPTN